MFGQLKVCISFGGLFYLSFSLLPCIQILVKTLHEETKEFLRILLTVANKAGS